MEQQPNMEEVIKELQEKLNSDSKVIQVLASIIKQQLMYGGSLADKINFTLYEAKKNSNKS
jgi:putative AlgH/UPF0301 family transcriptional regulator